LAYSDGVKGDRPPFDPVMNFKVLMIQIANTPPDERTEYLGTMPSVDLAIPAFA